MSSRGSTARGENTANKVAKVYPIFFLYVEPCFALIGACCAYFQPQTYLDLTHHPSSPQLGIPKSTQIILGQLANLYTLFAINEALVLRSTADLKVWRTVIICLLLADLGHLYSVRVLGNWIYWDVMKWNAMDWGNVGFVYVGAIVRVSFLAGVGTAPAHRRANKPRSPRIKA